MSTFVMSGKYPMFTKEIENMGNRVITSDCIKSILAPERNHADMQILQINDVIFMLNECSILRESLPNKSIRFCKNSAGSKYPDNILLNFLYLNGKLYGKKSAIDPVVEEYCIDNNIDIINVNQGYARCSTLVIKENAVITSDKSIEKALRKDGVDVLLILSGNIILDGFDYGFIGGASGKLDKNTIVFFGNIKKHPDYNIIRNFCNKYNVKIKIISEEMALTDIGGIVRID